MGGGAIWNAPQSVLLVQVNRQGPDSGWLSVCLSIFPKSNLAENPFDKTTDLGRHPLSDSMPRTRVFC